MGERQIVRPSERIAADLRRRLAADEWKPGQALPAVAKLAAQYGASRDAVTRAIHVLADEDLVRVIANMGIFRTPQGADPPCEVTT